MTAFPTSKDRARAAANGFVLPVHVERPTARFRTFVEQHFFDTRYGLRRENDVGIVGRLGAEERAAAIALVEANAPRGAPWLILAAAHLDLVQLVPAFKGLLEASSSPSFELVWALRRFGALDPDTLFRLRRGTLLDGGELSKLDVLDRAWAEFPLARAAELVEIGLGMPSYFVRCGGFNALLAMEAIARAGGVLTPELTRAIVEEERLWAMQGSRYPDRYPQYQLFVGAQVFADPALREERMAELCARLRAAVESAPP